MFEDSLIESGGKLKTARGWTSVVSFLIQFMIIGVMVLIPLIFTEALPKSIQLGFLVAPPPPPPPPPPAAAPVKIVKVIQTDIVNGQLRTPTKIPQKVQMIKEEEAPPPVMAATGVVGGVPGGVPGGSMGGVLGSIAGAGAFGDLLVDVCVLALPFLPGIWRREGVFREPGFRPVRHCCGFGALRVEPCCPTGQNPNHRLEQ